MKTLRVGEILVEEGVISANELEAGLAAQRKNGGPLGRTLILMGACTRLDLYQALARRWGTRFINLLDDPPASALIEQADATVMAEEQWLPWRAEAQTLAIASSRDPQEIRERVESLYPGKKIKFVTTTDWDITQVVMRMRRETLALAAAESLFDANPEASAKGGILKWQRVTLAVSLAVVAAGLIFNTTWTLLAIGIAANLMFTVAVGFKIIAAVAGRVQLAEHKSVAKTFAKVTGHDLAARLPDADLPTYTILVPVYHEANVVDMVIEHLGALDYPKSKLQVLILCEEDDEETIAAVKNAHPPEYVRLLVVPQGSPKTKPRACNFGLLFASGDYLVIFDAEDRPDPGQLRAAVTEFALADSADDKTPTVCVQAALNYFNWDTNLLTRLFTLEYSAWFDGMLPGMDLMRLPIPLGGTSNHFRIDLLRQIGGWDPYNVTEDADLGLRASSAGFKVGTVNSTTWEEACSKTPAWIRQRTRWIKGYMVTALVDLRRPVKFTRAAGARSLATMIGLIAGTPLMFLAYPLVWGMTLATYIGFSMTEFTMPEWIGAFAVWNFIVGNLAMIGVAAWTGARRHSWRLAGYALLNPIYWFMHAFAAWRALFQLIVDPHTWEKTPHGLTHEREEARMVT